MPLLLLPKPALWTPVEWRRFLLCAAAYMAVWLCTWYSAQLLETLGVASLWYLPGGLRFACLFVFGWLGLALELVTSLVLVLLQLALGTGAALHTAWAVQILDRVYNVAAFPLAYAAVVLPLRWRLGAALDLARPAHSVLFIGVALGAAALAAAAGSTGLLVLGGIAPDQWTEVFTSWLTGDFVGVITLTPWLLLVVWPRLRRYLDTGQWTRLQAPHAAAVTRHTTLLALASVLLVLSVPHLLGSRQQSPMLALLLLLPLAAVALRYNLRATVWAIVLLDSGLVLMVSTQHQNAIALQYQLEMVAISLVGLWLGGSVETRNRLMERYNQQLRREVAERTEALHRINGELVTKEQHLRVLLAAAPVGMLELDAAGCVQYLNANGSLITGYSIAQAQGLHLLDFVHAKDRERVAQAWNGRHQLDSVQSLEFRLRHSNIWCAAHWIKFPQAQETLARTIMVLVDSTVQHQQSEQLWTLAHTDLLTGLPNRGLFIDRCAQALSLAKRYETSAALFWIDLDGFKGVNDSLGHAAGDALLQQVAQRLKNRLRDSDTLARIGGDEFAVVMSDVGNAESAEQVAQTLVAGLRDPFDLPQGQTRISASIGIALYPLHADAVEPLMRHADIAMYSAKHAGKNQVQTWDESRPSPLLTSNS